jgi:hypothetical protein
MTTRVIDPETAALGEVMRVLVDPARAKGALEDHLCRLAHIHFLLAELDERERQVTAREANIRRREAAMRTKQ